MKKNNSVKNFKMSLCVGHWYFLEYLKFFFLLIGRVLSFKNNYIFIKNQTEEKKAKNFMDNQKKEFQQFNNKDIKIKR